MTNSGAESAPSPLTAAGTSSSPSDNLSALTRSYDILVTGLIGVHDLSESAAVRIYIAQVLARVGVDRVEVPTGASFDPSEYEAVTTVVTRDPVCHQRVAETLRPGWRRLDTVLRPPQVAVWIADPDAPTSSRSSHERY